MLTMHYCPNAGPKVIRRVATTTEAERIARDAKVWAYRLVGDGWAESYYLLAGEWCAIAPSRVTA